MKSFGACLIFYFCLIGLTSIGAFELPSACKDHQSTCENCTGDLLAKGTPQIHAKELVETMGLFGKLSFLNENVEKLDIANTALKKSLMPLMRSLRDGEKEESFKESMAEIGKIRNDFDRLVVLSKESSILQKKFDVCLHNCSASRRLEISDDIARIQKLKTALFLKRPILANNVFEKRMNEIKEDDSFNESQFREDLKEALYLNLQGIEERSKAYFHFTNDGKKPLSRQGNEAYIRDYLANVTSRYPSVVDDVLKNADFKDATPACFFARELKKHEDRKKIIEMGVDAGLFILPLCTGGLGGATEAGIELAFGKKLASWGLNSLKAKNMGLLINVGLIAKDGIDLKDFSDDCSRAEVQFLKQHDDKNLSILRKCQEELGEKIFLTELSVLSSGMANIGTLGLKNLILENKIAAKPLSLKKNAEHTFEISSYLKKKGLDDLKKGEVALEFKTPANGTFSFMDLKNVINSKDQNIKKLPEEYWRYVGNVYSERLNLTKEEIENFIKSSVEMGPRTKLILNTEGAPLGGKLKINGGVGVVESKGMLEPLPLEKANGLQLERKPGEKIVEIVRLTVGKNADAEKLSSDLMSQVSNLIVHDKDISRIFIFTSKIHARLYKRLGVPADKVKELGKRDVIIEFTRSELERVIEKKLPSSAFYDFIQNSKHLIIRKNTFYFYTV